MLGVKPFQELTNVEKVEFFLKCQQLLRDFHPKSDFIFRENNVAERMRHVAALSAKYKGFCYSNENICVLFNKIYVADERDPVTSLRENMYREPAKEYNAVSIDFVVFRNLNDCMEFSKAQYEPRIAYTVFVKNNQPKIYKTEKFISRILSIPIIS